MFPIQNEPIQCIIRIHGDIKEGTKKAHKWNVNHSRLNYFYENVQKSSLNDYLNYYIKQKYNEVITFLWNVKI